MKSLRISFIFKLKYCNEKSLANYFKYQYLDQVTHKFYVTFDQYYFDIINQMFKLSYNMLKNNINSVLSQTHSMHP